MECFQEIMDMAHTIKEVKEVGINIMEVIINNKVAKEYLLKSHLNQNYHFYLHNHLSHKILNLIQKRLDKGEEAVVLGDHNNQVMVLMAQVV